MADNQLMIVDEKQIEAFGTSLAKEGWGKGLSPEMKRMVARISLAYGFDPLMDDLMIMGGSKLYVTVAGLRRDAQRRGLLDGVSFERAIEPDDPAKLIRWKCSIRVKGAAYPFEEYGEVSPEDTNPVARKNPSTMARTRALGRALRIATGVSLPIAEDSDDYGRPHSREPRSGLSALVGLAKPEPVPPPAGMVRVEPPAPVEADFPEVVESTGDEALDSAEDQLAAAELDRVKRTELAEVLKLKWRETQSTKAQVIAALRGAAARTGVLLGEIPMKAGKMDIAEIPSAVLSACLNEVEA